MPSRREQFNSILIEKLCMHKSYRSKQDNNISTNLATVPTSLVDYIMAQHHHPDNKFKVLSNSTQDKLSGYTVETRHNSAHRPN